MSEAWPILYVLLLFGGAALNLFGLPGNWVMFGAALGYLLLVEPTVPAAIPIAVPMLLAFLALTGEMLEFAAGMAGAGKAGGSRRGIFLSMIGSIIGSLFGFSLGNLIVPVLGGLIGLFVFAGFGALVGAMIGEGWKGRTWEDSLKIGKAAMLGRILGTLAKSLIGGLMLCVGLLGLLY